MANTYLDKVSSTGIFQSRGSLAQDKPTYVKRDVDDKFYQSIREGNFSYLFSPRDMGKTSLRIRLMERLQEDGYVCSFVDMSSLGTNNVFPEQWYYAFLFQLCRGLGLTSKLKGWWREGADTTPVNRVIEFFNTVVLKDIPEQIVIFIDEVETMQNLDANIFNINEFFAAIRSFYNLRADNAEYNRLNFVVMGVATPQELMTDPERSPFLIGREFMLDNINLEESEPLEAGFDYFEIDKLALMREVFAWTSGQPLLTQRICEAMAKGEDDIKNIKETVYNYTNDLYLKKTVTIESDPHLLAIQNRILRNSDYNTKMITLYQEIYNKQQVVYDPEDLTHRHLYLAGLIRVSYGSILINNQIYKIKFDLEWIGTQLKKFDRPFSNDLNRWLSLNKAKSAALKGEVLRQALIWAGDRNDLSPTEKRFLEFSRRVEKDEERRKRRILIAMLIMAAVLLVGAIWMAIVAESLRSDAVEQKRLAEVAADTAEYQRDLAEKAKAQSEMDKRRAEELKIIAEEEAEKARLSELEAQRQKKLADASAEVARKNEKDAKVNEKLAKDNEAEAKRLTLLSKSQSLAFKATLNYDDPQMNGLLAMQSYKFNKDNGGKPNDAAIHKALSNAQKKIDPNYRNNIQLQTELLSAFVFGEQNTMIGLSLASDLALYDMTAEKIIGYRKLKNASTVPVDRSFLFPLQGMALLSYEDGKAYLDLVGTGKNQSIPLVGHTGLLRSAKLNSDASLLATGGRDGKLLVWDLTGPVTAPKYQYTFASSVRSLEFAKTGTYIYTADESGGVFKTDYTTGAKELIGTQAGRRAISLCMSPNGRTLAVGYSDGLIELFDLQTLKLLRPINNAGETGIEKIVIDKASTMMAIVNASGIIRIYQMDDLSREPITIGEGKKVQDVAFHEDGKIYALCRDNKIYFWETSVDKLASNICNNLDRNLTEEEWKREVGTEIPYQETCKIKSQQ